jgi:hypothetical protein
MRLFKRKPQPFKGTAELTWLKEDSKEDSTKS